MKIDISLSAIKEIRNKFDELVSSDTRLKQEKLLADLKNATPVDTGFAKASWKLEVGETSKITNVAHYIDDLNAGSSNQAPLYFVERSLLSHEFVRPNGVIVSKL